MAGKFTLTINTGNAAFHGLDYTEELSRCLFEVVRAVERGQTTGNIRDINGNTVGTFKTIKGRK